MADPREAHMAGRRGHNVRNSYLARRIEWVCPREDFLPIAQTIAVSISCSEVRHPASRFKVARQLIAVRQTVVVVVSVDFISKTIRICVEVRPPGVRAQRATEILNPTICGCHIGTRPANTGMMHGFTKNGLSAARTEGGTHHGRRAQRGRMDQQNMRQRKAHTRENQEVCPKTNQKTALFTELNLLIPHYTDSVGINQKDKQPEPMSSSEK
jgi:hypothetical protein